MLQARKRDFNGVSCQTGFTNLPEDLFAYLNSFVPFGLVHTLRRTSKRFRNIPTTRQIEEKLKEGSLTLAVVSKDPRTDFTTGRLHIGYMSGIMLDGKVQSEMWMIITTRMPQDLEEGYEHVVSNTENYMRLRIDAEVIWSLDMYAGCQQYRFDSKNTLSEALEFVSNTYNESASKFISKLSIPYISGVVYRSLTKHNQQLYAKLGSVPRWYGYV